MNSAARLIRSLAILAACWTCHSQPAPAEEPVVRMLVPGFTVRELPVRLSNINNLRFAPDGRLTALGYDGRVYLLRDTTGDGLEDTADVFWEQPTLRVPVGMAWSPDGLYVSSQGKVSLLRDTSGDGVADTEQIIASGWSQTDVASGGVDAAAVTLAGNGDLYFGLLTANYSNPYRVMDGIARYDISGVRGTIQKIPAGSRAMETFVTGIRVPFALAFNRHGDLFVTDQEGETWLPGGNPLDELNHLIPGRHYGFPPRHETYLPAVIDEPPVIAFGPQHQSTCGFFFNEATPSQAALGPAWWEGDAIVAGQSRGKIWRARLVKTPGGYIGKETLIASLAMLTVDVALSPAGDLYVACHSGSPDWGTGPKGDGKLFKISYTDPGAAQPVLAWAAGLMEVRVAFDRPVDDSVLAKLGEIEFGEYVRAADRYEALKPPYKAVNEQMAAPRGKLKVASARLSPDRRELILATDPHPRAVTYALSLTEVRAANSAKGVATVDLAYDLSGVEARWTARGSDQAAWTGWLPHIDSGVNRALVAKSATHLELGQRVLSAGTLRLQSRLQLPKGPVTLHLEGNSFFEARLAGARTRASAGPVRHRQQAKLSIDSDGQPQSLLIDFETGTSGSPEFHAGYSTESDPSVRPVPLGFFYLPWAPPPRPPVAPPPRVKPDLAGGSFQRGKNLFFSDKLQCGACHRIRGEGRENGPDLSNLVHRDAGSVLRDILEPNTTINPDYAGYRVELASGGELSGFVRAHGEEALRVTSAAAVETIVPRAEIKELRPSPVSLMPSGLLDGLSEGQIRDLLTFLVHEPPTRTPAQIEAVLKALDPAGPREDPRALRIVLVAGKQDHGPGEHDYPACQGKWSELLQRAKNVAVSDVWEWPSREEWNSADVILFYFWNRDWTAAQFEQMDRFLERGGGLVMIHSATIHNTDPKMLARRIGLAAQPGPTKYLHAPFELVVQNPGHPLMAGLPDKSFFLDEPYWPMIGDPAGVTLLAGAELEGEIRPMMWTFERNRGRVFVSVPGHYTWTHEDPLFQIIILRGIAWAAGEPEGRLQSLVFTAR